MTKKNDSWISHPEFLSSGYESGMHFIAGVLLAVMEAEDAFWCLCSIIALRPKSKPPIREWANISDWNWSCNYRQTSLCMFMLSQKFGAVYIYFWYCEAVSHRWWLWTFVRIANPRRRCFQPGSTAVETMTTALEWNWTASPRLSSAIHPSWLMIRWLYYPS